MRDWGTKLYEVQTRYSTYTFSFEEQLPLFHHEKQKKIIQDRAMFSWHVVAVLASYTPKTRFRLPTHTTRTNYLPIDVPEQTGMHLPGRVFWRPEKALHQPRAPRAAGRTSSCRFEGFWPTEGDKWLSAVYNMYSKLLHIKPASCSLTIFQTWNTPPWKFSFSLQRHSNVFSFTPLGKSVGDSQSNVPGQLTKLAPFSSQLTKLTPLS